MPRRWNDRTNDPIQSIVLRDHVYRISTQTDASKRHGQPSGRQKANEFNLLTQKLMNGSDQLV